MKLVNTTSLSWVRAS